MEYSKLIEVRRSVRSYEAGKKISKEDWNEILRASALAPTWKNSETGRYYIVEDENVMEEIRQTMPSFNQRSSANAAALVVTTFVKSVSGFSNGEADNEIGEGWGAYDLGLQNSYFLLKARELGIDSLIMGLRDGEKIREVLSIPQEEEVMAVIALGYSNGNVAGTPNRKKPEEIAKFY